MHHDVGTDKYPSESVPEWSADSEGIESLDQKLDIENLDWS